MTQIITPPAGLSPSAIQPAVSGGDDVSPQLKLRLKIAMAIAFVAVAFEGNQAKILTLFSTQPGAASIVGLEDLILLLTGAVLVFYDRFSRLAIGCFAVAIIPEIPAFFGLANHTLLAWWCVLPALLVSNWITSIPYAVYLRITFGLVMIAACCQKLVAGTYVDGSYLYFLITQGKTSTQWFGFLCGQDPAASCIPIVAASNVILVWQFIVGVFLIIGWKNILVLIIEVGFLLGAGLFADEFNFQILNIALLTIVFRTGIPISGAFFCLAVLIADLWGIGELYLMARGLF